MQHIAAGNPKEIRTPVFGVRGRYPRPLDDGAIKEGDFVFCPRSATPAGFQPTIPSIKIRQLLHLPRLPTSLQPKFCAQVLLYLPTQPSCLRGEEIWTIPTYPFYYLKPFCQRVVGYPKSGTRERGPSFLRCPISAGFYLNLRGSCDFNRHNRPWECPNPPRWTSPMGNDPIVKLLFSVAEPAHYKFMISDNVRDHCFNEAVQVSSDLLFRWISSIPVQPFVHW